MYCSSCGCAGTGNFCSQCGALLSSSLQPTLDWERYVRYDQLIRLPRVRAMIEEHARRSPKRISGEKFLELCEKLLPGGAPLELLAPIVQPIYASWRIGTGKQRAEAVRAPIGRVLVRLMCSLAAEGQTLRQVQQAQDGCLIEAALPSDMWSLEGDLLVVVRAHGEQTEVQAATKIKGQLFDWGKSTRCLERLFADLRTEAASQQGTKFRHVA